MSLMHLSISSLGAVVVDDAQVSALRAEDASGSFGILPGHADFLTTLEIGVVSWRTASGEAYCAVRGGVLTVEDGCRIAIATREAIADGDLEHLESTVVKQLRSHEDAERSARVESTRMELRLVREVLRYLRPGQT